MFLVVHLLYVEQTSFLSFDLSFFGSYLGGGWGFSILADIKVEVLTSRVISCQVALPSSISSFSLVA